VKQRPLVFFGERPKAHDPLDRDCIGLTRAWLQAVAKAAAREAVLQRRWRRQPPRPDSRSDPGTAAQSSQSPDSLISPLDGVTEGQGPSTLRFVSSAASLRALSEANRIAAGEARFTDENATISKAIFASGGGFRFVPADAFGHISGGGGAIGLESAAGAVGLLTRLPSFVDDSPVGRGSPQLIRRALDVSETIGNVPVFLVAPRGGRTALAGESDLSPDE